MNKNLFGLARIPAPAVLVPAVLSAAVTFAGMHATPARAQNETIAKVVMQAPLRVVDPILTNAYVTRNHGYMVFDTLFALDANGKPQPEMVESWKETPDKLTMTLTLRKDLKFHDGAPVTGEDVIASLKRWAERDALGQRLMAATAKLESPDPRTVVFRLKTPFGLLLEALAKPGSPVPFIMPKRIAATPASQPISEVIGSGPYKFVAATFQPGVRASYVKFADYVPRKEPASGFAGGKVAVVDRIEMVNISDAQTAVNALRRGEIDFVEDVPPDLVSQLEGVKTVALKSYGKSTNMFTLRMNWLQPPFNNVKVRRAALAALYQADYLDAQIGDGKMYQVCGAVLSCMSPYASEDGATQTKKPDLARAKALLKESGYDGSKVVILHPTDLPILASLASVTAQALKSIGMNVEIQSMDWATLLSRYSKKDGVAQGGWSIFQTGFSSLDLMNPITNPNLDGRGEAGYVGWSRSEEMEKLRDRFADESDPATKKQIALAIQKLNYDQVFFIPLGAYSKVKGYNAVKLGSMTDAQIPLFWSGKK
ncbi:ABC transporter substrate-binding protein [Cupriavidus sp. SW-Y-13]|uniref:ABC transporter substrate-binding protein n=1 Tax=Cupriavidus sp. SW-Y-13 TaxID=2653854 RepID=UPI0013654ADC|nr:ABC transporter substrate-binding protein [Cupriavidus sp. SW-Y-13]MWL86888.1 ABC transporter substrate-binding protein [Cupriavidus sp. SW-Y-13]